MSLFLPISDYFEEHCMSPSHEATIIIGINVWFSGIERISAKKLEWYLGTLVSQTDM